MKASKSVLRVVTLSAVTVTVVLLTAQVSSVEAELITLTPQADNWVSSCTSGCTVNNGDMNEVRVRTSWWGSAGNREPKNFRIILEFDLGALPADADLITGATLGLYYFNRPHDDPVGRSCEVRRVINSWDETNSTWQARDDYNEPSPLYWDGCNAGTPAYQPGGGDVAATVYSTALVPVNTAGPVRATGPGTRRFCVCSSCRPGGRRVRYSPVRRTGLRASASMGVRSPAGRATRRTPRASARDGAGRNARDTSRTSGNPRGRWLSATRSASKRLPASSAGRAA